MYKPLTSTVSLQALRLSYDRLFDAGFEDVLREADAVGSSSVAAAGAVRQPVSQPQEVAGCETVLLNKPKVFTLAVVWESPQVS